MTHSDYPVSDLPTPDPRHGPETVVEIQLEALADNDDPVENAGIKTAYNFASPANRRVTGPLDRFVRMVEGPRYAPMIDHVEAETDPVERSGEQAKQRVALTGSAGRTVSYQFALSVCDREPLDGCWLTDSVLD
ncbi:protein of unknown function [Halovenus aranensis]|jgi:hypothetical protein|uniref:DUF4864 domain-containing protein n=1 Tax=Halovenus aranensis TaxID=890420 RepID=A0A1G8Y3Y5_9EURY|nr:DUF4864 domain-containing protein [Halovenus aranensis]SDJ97383.1 protein of unknown function [Halovenus aranensis]